MALPSPLKRMEFRGMEYVIPVSVLHMQMSRVICPLLFPFARYEMLVSALELSTATVVSATAGSSIEAIERLVRMVSMGTASGLSEIQGGACASAMLDMSRNAQTVAGSLFINVPSAQKKE